MDFYQKDFDASFILRNNIPVEDFEGFSSADMHYIIYETLSPDSPFQIKKNIPNNVLDQIPFFLQVEFLLERINDLGELKLTATGSLPTALVRQIYDKGFIKDDMIDRGIIKLYAETSSRPIHLARMITELAGFTKKRNNKLSLTKLWKNKLEKKGRQEIFIQTFSTFAHKFNWGYFDYYECQSAGQLGYAFTLYLISKYGDKERRDKFYSEKYLIAFPAFLDEFYDFPLEKEKNRSFNSCYSVRTFDRFLEYFNLISSREEGKVYHDKIKIIKKSEIFDKIITFEN